VARKTVLVAGGSGLVGYACLKHFASEDDCDVLVLSRRPPPDAFGARVLQADLTDPAALAALAGAFAPVTHLVYTALYETPQLIAGWRDAGQIATNAAMLRNLFEPLEKAAKGLRHVTLLQGTKAYGVHVRPIPTPAREDRDEARDVPNFYWEQQDYLAAKRAGQDWSATVFRPQVIFGESFGSAMNLIPALGTYGALLKARGEPLHYPGGEPNITEGVDADLLARAIAWAGEAPAAADQAFNITNGDVFLWQEVWPAIADALGMEPGEKRPLALAAEMPARAAEWDAIRAAHGLAAPPLVPYVGLSFQYSDSVLGYGDERRAVPAIVSTVKLRKAGFTEVIDTEAMFRKWFRLFQDRRLLPPA
jgi:nucleoside-diphosphate-sugar epimerase